MKIESIKSTSKASGYSYEMIFSEGDEKIGKSMEIASIRGFDPEAFSRMFLRLIRQAERDFAYMKHGDEWRRHVGQFWGPVTEREIELFDEAAALMRPLLEPETIH